MAKATRSKAMAEATRSKEMAEATQETGACATPENVKMFPPALRHSAHPKRRKPARAVSKYSTPAADQ